MNSATVGTAREFGYDDSKIRKAIKRYCLNEVFVGEDVSLLTSTKSFSCFDIFYFQPCK